MTMTTVGYGDITPKNNYELIFANINMFPEMALCYQYEKRQGEHHVGSFHQLEIFKHYVNQCKLETSK